MFIQNIQLLCADQSVCLSIFLVFLVSKLPMLHVFSRNLLALFILFKLF